MKFVIGRKLQMTQIFDEEGLVHPVTVIGLEPMCVTKLCTVDKDSYEAVQVGYGGEKKEDVKKRKEFRGDTSGLEADTVIDATKVFIPGDVVRVTATSKGKGFQGVVKRHGFAGGPRTHGQKHTERSPGSIGSGLRSRVPRGTKMPGRMGGDQVTIKGSRIMAIDENKKLLLLRGSIPGRRGTVVEIQGI